MPRNFVTVSGTVNIDGAPRQKNIALFNYSNKITPVDTAVSSAVDGSWSKYCLKERDGYLLGVAFSDYGKVWSASKVTTLGQRVTPKFPNNHWYECTTAGTTGTTEPTWNVSGGTNSDGTVVWTDRGLMETPIARGPFPLDDPGVADPNVIFLTRNHELNGTDEVSGTLAVNNGAVSVVAGKFPNTNSLNFDGSSGTGANYPPVPPGSGDWTLEVWFWMNAISPSASQPFFYMGDLNSNNHRLQLGLTTNNGVEGYVSIGLNGGTTSFGASNPITAANLVTANTWNHIVFEKFGDNTYLYLNGAQRASVSHNAGFWFNPVTASSYTYIGTGRVASVIRYVNCRVGEVRFSNIARYSGAASYTVPTAPYVV